ncbi:hypothetical protein [Micromonospora sp. NPDC007220]|uniref:hypothetical protein n=1 Tax=Micromonospora sp. NPDC007220 TaxID=3154318 RepID=UPI00340ED8E6
MFVCPSRTFGCSVSVRPTSDPYPVASAEASLAALRFDTAILGCCGLTADGLTAYDLADAAMKRAIIASAHRVIVVADPAKFARTALAFVAPISAISMVVTTDDVAEDDANALVAAGTIVHRA